MIIFTDTLIQDPVTGQITYPDAMNLFGLTHIIGGNLVGEYSGVLPLAIYGGTWPPAPVIAYQANFSPADFLEQLTDVEVHEVIESNNKTVKDYISGRLQMWSLVVKPTDPAFIDFVNTMETQAIIDVPRRDILLLGVPQ